MNSHSQCFWNAAIHAANGAIILSINIDQLKSQHEIHASSVMPAGGYAPKSAEV